MSKNIEKKCEASYSLIVLFKQQYIYSDVFQTAHNYIGDLEHWGFTWSF